LSAAAKPRDVPPEQLIPADRHVEATRLITRVIDQYHYASKPLNNDLSEAILKGYVESLDPGRSFFTAEDIRRFEHHATEIDDKLRIGSVELAFDIFRTFRERVEAQTARGISLLEGHAFDFSRDEHYALERDTQPWPADQTALDELWRMRVKNDILSQRMAGKAPDEVTDTLRKRYNNAARRIRQLTADDVYQTYINAYTLAIEPHTSYMSPSTSENFDIRMRLSLQGIGAMLRTVNEHTIIQSLITGGPAKLSGQLAPGDRVLAVAQGEDGEYEDVIGWRIQEVAERIRGPKGTIVRLLVLPKGAGLGGRPREVAIVRNNIKLEEMACSNFVLDDLPGLEGLRIGVIDVPTFYRDFGAQSSGDKEFRSTTRDVRAQLAELEQQNVDGVVIDLRDNGGGSLDEATELTGLFIDQGPVVQIRDSSNKVRVRRDTQAGVAYDGPLAVLVNRNSASASEIFAGAIQDYGRGIVVGEPTFGKGTVQTLVDLNRFTRKTENLGRLRLTMAQFFRVNGDSTQHRGVVPDIVFPTAEGAGDHGERALDNALPFTSITPLEHERFPAPDIPALLARHEQRLAADEGFAFLLEQQRATTASEERERVSLAEEEREQEWKDNELRNLDRRNRFREANGLPPLTVAEATDPNRIVGNPEDDPETKAVEAIELNETAIILADHIRMSRNARTAATTH
ncbi:MAG: carboxy terminal-processing peptidase, partial [Gammaproteobacteria bacterium]